MTYYVTALTNNAAKLIEKTLCTNCKDTADAVEASWTELGFIVVRKEEY